MYINPSISAALHDVTGPITADFSPGQQHVLGTYLGFSGDSGGGSVIAYIATATPPAGFLAGDVVHGPGYSNLTNINVQLDAGLIEAFTLEADSGHQVWLYVRTGIAISRGEAVELDPTLGGVYEVLKGTEAGKVKGVAQWNLPSGFQGWVLCSGVGKALAGTAGVTQGERLEITPAGAAEDVTALADVGYGRALEAAAVGVLFDADICAPG